MKQYDLVIIGAGAAGMACAASSYDQGITNLLLLERETFLGGILRQCFHRGFGKIHFDEVLTGPEFSQRWRDEIVRRAISFHTDSMVSSLEITDKGILVSYTNPIGFQTVLAKAVVCATGCSEKTRGGIALSGDRPSGVMNCGLAQRYINLEGYHIGDDVFILGSGDIGLITAKRLVEVGARVHGIAEIMPYSSGLPENIKNCQEKLGIPLFLKHTVKWVAGKNRLSEVIIAQVDDNMDFVPGTEKSFKVDTLLLAVGLVPYNPILERSKALIHPVTKGPIVDDNYQTSLPGVFACGNSLHVHDLVDHVSAEGTKVGIKAAEYIRGLIDNSKKVLVDHDESVSYCLPQTIHQENSRPTEIFFRSKKIGNGVITISQSGKTLLQREMQLHPATLSKVELPVYQLDDSPLMVSICYLD